MFSKLLKKMALFGAICLLASCESQVTPTATPATPASIPVSAKAIAIADVSSKPGKKIGRYQPLADYLATHLEEYNVGQVKIAQDLETIAEWLKTGQVDLYFDSPYPAAIVSEKSGAEPILRRWKEGQSDYYGIIFTLRDRGIASLADLAGRTLAFDTSYSTSGYMLPMAVLLNAGLNPVEKTDATKPVPPNAIGYVFSNDDENTIQWTIAGKVDAGAIDIRNYLKISQQTRSEMLVLAETDRVARHVVLVRSNMDPQLKQAIETLLLNMDRTPEGKAVLEQFENTAKFDRFPPESSLAKMRELYERVKNR